MARSTVTELAAQRDRPHRAMPLPDHRDGPSPLDVDILIGFFDTHGRDLPWRDPTASPWAVLVSEVMLQQTPVVRVLPVFTEWLQRWPRPADLAADSPAAAIRAWGRLGYPRRAMRLHAAATAITVGHGGVVTDDVIRSLSISQHALGTREIMIIHHTDCGLARLEEDKFRSHLATSPGTARPGRCRRSRIRTIRCANPCAGSGTHRSCCTTTRSAGSSST